MNFLFLFLAITFVFSSRAVPIRENQSPSIDSSFVQLSLFRGSPDPEVMMGPAEIIQRWGYPHERHDAITEDGYILSMYRIPHGKNNETITTKKPVVFFMHGLEGSCTNWLTNLPNESAAYIFADAGFDVWMGNFRGNTYSKTHVKLSNKDHAYWQFSWDEMARYDLPAMINQALNVSGVENLYYVGHSMGTLTAFAKFSEDQILAKKIKQFYALGPVYALKDIKGLLKYLAPVTKYFEKFFDWVGYDDFTPNSWFVDMIAKYVCNNRVGDYFCKGYYFSLAGPSQQMNSTRVPVYLAHSPAGTSVQNIAHFGQMHNNGKFEKYDYGSAEENKKHYGQATPPLYDVSKLQVPVGLYWGAQDWLADPNDVKSLIPLIQKNLIANTYLTDFSHLDFIWGLKAAKEVYQPILDQIRKDISA